MQIYFEILYDLYIVEEKCPETCKCKSASRDTPGRRNLQHGGDADGYCFYWCGLNGYCGVSKEIKALGQDCRPCRMKFLGY